MALYEFFARALRAAYSNVNSPPVLQLDLIFPEHRKLLAAFDALQRGSLALIDDLDAIPRFDEISKTQVAYSKNDGKDWRLFAVKAYRHEICENSARTPTLRSFIRTNERVTSAALSILGPGKHIPPHWGPFRGIARYHLCLRTGQDSLNASYLILDGKVYPYEEMGCLLWDDTYLHEVFNPTPEIRVALLLDIQRNDLPFFLRLLTEAILAGGYLIARVLHSRLRVDSGQKITPNSTY